MNDLEKYFKNNMGRLIHKWDHYFEIYDRHFSKYRGTGAVIVEFGVSHGGSLQMWRNYFGPEARIIGVDINPACKTLEGDGVEIIIGSQEDRDFLASLKERIPRIDILIDDGGHTMRQQRYTFEELFYHIAPDGVYLCEDLSTSYWPDMGGGYRGRGTFIEYSKNLIDQINAWHSVQPERLAVSDFTKSANSLHYYDGVLVIEKRPREKPQHRTTGEPAIPPLPGMTLIQRIRRRVSLELDRFR